MTLCDWLEDKHRNGFLLKGAERLLRGLSCASPMEWFQKWARKRYPRRNRKAPQWATEVYQVGSMLLVIALYFTQLVLYGRLSCCLWVLSLVVALLSVWRILEIGLFALQWAISSKPIHSYRRSLVGFGLNVTRTQRVYERAPGGA